MSIQTHKIGVNTNSYLCSNENKTKKMVVTPIVKWNAASPDNYEAILFLKQ